MQETIIEKIYNNLQDDISKYIFLQRIAYNLTDDYQYIFNILMNAHCYDKEFQKFIGKEIVIFGAGKIGKWVKQKYKDLNIIAFVDNNQKEKEYDNIPILNFQKYLDSYSKCYVIIANKYHNVEIEKQLLNSQIEQEKIINLSKIMQSIKERQYFDLPQLCSGKVKEEVFVDCGCYDAFNSLQFVKWCNGNYKKIWAFEPDIKNLAICKTMLESKNINNYELIDSGLWNQNTDLKFVENGTSGASISEDGNVSIKVNRLDDILQGEVTFIKMDIEGAEYNAILGCEKIIKKYRPKFAISVYHLKDDIIKIPELLLKINSEYKFYLRHYSVFEYDTVLYAI